MIPTRTSSDSSFLYRSLVIFFMLVPYGSFAAQSPYDKEESEIPNEPSTPPSLVQKVPSNRPHCERYYVYQGKKLECDSNLGNDAERLRPLMEDIPASIAELDAFQNNRQNVRLAAYFGTFGLLLIVTGLILGRTGTPAFDQTSGRPNFGGWIMVGGLGITVNSLLIGISVGSSNGAHVGNAVQYFNEAHPDRPIELKFSTDVNF